MARRTARAAGLAEKLFVMIMLGDDRAVAATHLMGRRAWQGRQSGPGMTRRVP